MVWSNCFFLFLVIYLILPTGDCGEQAQLDCTEFEDATELELKEAALELDQGKLSPDGLKLFRCQAQVNPNDWRVHGMLGQALIRRPGELDDGIEALRRAWTQGPVDGKARYNLSRSLAQALRRKLQEWPDRGDQAGRAEVRREAIDVLFRMLRERPSESASWLWLGRLLSVELPLNKDTGVIEDEAAQTTYTNAIREVLPRKRKVDKDPAVAAWTAAVKRSPKLAEAHELLAWRLMQGGSSKRARKHATKVVKLQPKVATSHEVLAASLTRGKAIANLTKSERKKATKAYKAALYIRNQIPKNKNKDKQTRDTGTEANNHYKLFRLLSTDPAVDETEILAGGEVATQGMQLLSEALAHIKKAAEIRPDQYGDLDEKFKDLEGPLNKANSVTPESGGLDFNKLSHDQIKTILDAAAATK